MIELITDEGLVFRRISEDAPPANCDCESIDVFQDDELGLLAIAQFADGTSCEYGLIHKTEERHEHPQLA